MDAVHAALLDAVRAFLLAEAGRIGRHRLRELILGEDLIDVAADHGVLARADQIEILALDLVHHGVHIRLAHDALDDVAVDHERRDAVGKALADHEIARVGQHGLVQTRDIAHEIVKTVAGDAARGVKIDAVKALHDLRVVRDREIRHDGLAEALHLHIAAIVRAERHAGVDDLRDGEHDLVNFRLELFLLLFELGQTRRLRGDLRLDGLGLLKFGWVLFRLAHEHADLFRQGVALCAQVRRLVDCGAVGLVKLDHFVDERELGVLKLFADVFPNQIGVFADQSNVNHDVSVSSTFYVYQFLRPMASSACSSASRSSAS